MTIVVDTSIITHIFYINYVKDVYMSHTLQHIHANVGLFNGILYFTLDNKLLTMEVITPHFNDYGEWRIKEIFISDDDYNPEENTVELVPFAIQDIQLNDKELSFVKNCFTKDYDRCDKYLENNKDISSPFDYTGDVLLASGFYSGNDNLTHFIHKPDGFDSRNIPMTLLDKEVFAKDWNNKEDITAYQGLYNLLIPIMEGFVKSYMKSNQFTKHLIFK